MVWISIDYTLDSEIRYLKQVVVEHDLFARIFTLVNKFSWKKEAKHSVHFSIPLLVSPICKPCELASYQLHLHGKIVVVSCQLVFCQSSLKNVLILVQFARIMRPAFERLSAFSKQTSLQILAQTRNYV